MKKNNITKIFFIVAFMILSTSGVFADTELGYPFPSDPVSMVATHTPNINIDPVLTQADSKTVFTVTVGNNAGDNIEEVWIITPPGFTDLTCGNPISGWLLQEETEIWCRYITNEDRIEVDDSVDFTVNVMTASEDGDYEWEVRTFDNVRDFISTSLMTTIDSTVPSIKTYDVSEEIFSPNEDGIKDVTEIDLEFSERVDYTINILDGSGANVKELSEGAATDPNAKIWDGTNNDNEPLADGVYTVEIVLEDKAGNSATDASKKITIDATAPIINSAITLSTTKVDVFFSEDLDDATLASALSEFSIVGDNEHILTSVSELNGVVTLVLSGEQKIAYGEELKVVYTPTTGLADLVGNKVQESRVAVTNNLPEYDLALTLNEGWNLISVPKMLKQEDLERVLSGLNYEVITTYDGATWVLPSTVEPLNAYWINVPNGGVIYLKYLVCTNGPDCIPASRSLESGWQLVGFTGTEPMDSELALSSIERKYSQWFGFKNNEWISHIFGEQDKEMEPTLGYWIFMTDEGTLAAVSL